MILSSLCDLQEAISACWGPETCDPVDLGEWSPGNPSCGQCGVTALVVQDLLGGELMTAEVRHADGSRQGVHYWNRLQGGLELDLTRAQFRRGETIGEPAVIERPVDTSHGRLAHQYGELSQRVASRLLR